MSYEYDVCTDVQNNLRRVKIVSGNFRYIHTTIHDIIRGIRKASSIEKYF